MPDSSDIGRQTILDRVVAPQDADGTDLVCIEGVVDRIVYENGESGFFVARLRADAIPGLVTFVGNLLAVSAGETVRLWGRWIEAKQYGRELRVEKYQTILPTTARGIEKYLGSGLIEGIGPKFAHRLVTAFGVETLRVIEDEPERLRSVRGIGPKRAAQIREAWAAQKTLQSIMLFLQGHGIGVAQAVKIYKRYGDGAVAVLRENPYRLAEDISGIAFKSADAIAAELGIAKDSPRRIEAGLLFALRQIAMEGHVFLSEPDLFDQAHGLLEVDAGLFEQPLRALVARGDVVRDGGAAYLAYLHAAETGSARLLKRLIATPPEPLAIKVEKAIEWVQQTHGIQLSEEQRLAIRTAVDAKVMVITGGPGTGKTTVLKSLLSIFEKKGVRIVLAAPTGRAAKRMESATERQAKTIHRLLEYSPKEGRFTRNEADPLNADLVVIDETSMVDIVLMHALLRALKPATRLILVGDVDQLPSVGPGNVLLDVISSQAVHVVWLKTVFRQAAQSGIIANAHRINRGEFPEFNAEDFFFVRRVDPVAARETVLELVTKRIPRRFGLDPLRAIQVLAPMHRGEAGVSKLNETLRGALNPGGEPLPHRTFGLGDKVMQLRNNYELDVYNGDVGIVTVVDQEARELQVRFDDDRVVLYPFDQLDELTLAYATTVHKAQGSEYPAVVIPLLTQHYMMLQRNVFYTAVTRASRLVIIVGDPNAVRMAVRNTAVTRRNTRLTERLRNQTP